MVWSRVFSSPRLELNIPHRYVQPFLHTDYIYSVYQIQVAMGVIPLVPGRSEVCKYFPEPGNIPILSSFVKGWFLTFEPNEASWVHFLCERLLIPTRVLLRWTRNRYASRIFQSIQQS